MIFSVSSPVEDFSGGCTQYVDGTWAVHGSRRFNRSENKRKQYIWRGIITLNAMRRYQCVFTCDKSRDDISGGIAILGRG